jgi:hypothetical protein
MEFWALAPERIHPPRHVLVAGGQWLVNTIDNMSEEQIEENYAFLTHAGKALAAWRNREPVDVLIGSDRTGP